MAAGVVLGTSGAGALKQVSQTQPWHGKLNSCSSIRQTQTWQGPQLKKSSPCTISYSSNSVTAKTVIT
jgi:hypothetical protein